MAFDPATCVWLRFGLFRLVALRDPASANLATRVLAIPVKRASRDTALIVQRQFRDRFKRCLSRFNWCCEALLDSVSGAEHTRALRARLEGDLRGAASDQVLAKGFTDEAYERLNRAMAAAQKGPIARRSG